MTKELELKWELETIAKQTIDQIFNEDGLVHISTVEEPEKYFIVDCQQEYYEWFITNKAETDDYINVEDYDHEDGCTSTSKTLHPDIDIWNVKDFSEFVRAISEKYWIKDNEYILEIELNELIHNLSKFKCINKSNVPIDVRKKINQVLLACRNIGFLD